MCFFRKKKLYLLTWSYGSCSKEHFTDLIKAYDFHDCWKKHKKNHPIATYCIKMKEIV